MPTTLHAPYGFVPLNDQVYRPDWAAEVSQDWPAEDGLCGTLQIEVEAETPIFVRGAIESTKFFRGPDGVAAIPGSSLRGALRSVVEIASFGWMRRVNDHRYGVRDLQNQKLYVRHMAGLMPRLSDGENAPMPKVVAGWLQRAEAADLDEDEDGSTAVATITPCDFAKIDYRLLQRATPAGRRLDFGRRASAPMKYNAWGVASGDEESRRKLALRVDWERLRPPSPEWLGREFGRVTALGGQSSGTLVMTGQPSEWDPNRPPRGASGHPKHHDFVFLDAAGARPIHISRSTFRDFEFVHSDGNQQHSLNRRVKPNDEWGFWRPFFERGERVPVFFLVGPDGGVRAFGLAMMFRLAYANSVGDIVRRLQPGLARGEGPDLAELLFGHVPLARGDAAKREPLLKGRVSVGLGRLAGGGAELPAVTTVLGAPKASFYPAYVEQDNGAPGRDAPGHDKDRYRTYMDGDSRIRGHKRYRIQPGVVQGAAPPKRGDGSVNEGVGTTFRPLDTGSRFEAEIRVHNVRPAELGALLWALDFGGEADARHALGMARSLGYGRCRLRVKSHDLRANNDWDQVLDDTALQAAREAFAAGMERFCAESNVEGGWAHSRRIHELLALAIPLEPDSPHRYHLRLKAPAQFDANRTINEFVAVKKDGLGLPAAGTDAGWVARAAAAGVKVRLAGVSAQGGAPASRGSEPGRGGPPSRGGPPGRAAVPPVQASRSAGWSGIKGGTEVEVDLLELNKKGKWRGRVVGRHAVPGIDATGVISGEPPGEVTAGAVVRVVVVAGGDPKNLGLKWT